MSTWTTTKDEFSQHYELFLSIPGKIPLLTKLDLKWIAQRGEIGEVLNMNVSRNRWIEEIYRSHKLQLHNCIIDDGKWNNQHWRDLSDVDVCVFI